MLHDHLNSLIMPHGLDLLVQQKSLSILGLLLRILLFLVLIGRLLSFFESLSDLLRHFEFLVDVLSPRNSFNHNNLGSVGVHFMFVCCVFC